MNIAQSLPHSHAYLCSARFIVNVTHQNDNDRNLQAIYCYACYLVGLLARAWYGMENGMEWNGNFDMEYGRCQDGMEWKISRMKWKTIFHTSIPIPF